MCIRDNRRGYVHEYVHMWYVCIYVDMHSYLYAIDSCYIRTRIDWTHIDMGIHCIYIKNRKSALNTGYSSKDKIKQVWNLQPCTHFVNLLPGTGHSDHNTSRKRIHGQSCRPCGGIADGYRAQGEMDAVGFGGRFLEDSRAAGPLCFCMALSVSGGIFR